MIKPFFLALQFLTRLPAKNYDKIADIDVGRSVIFYPLVGLIIGSILVGIEYAFSNVSAPLLALIILIASVLLSGGLHLDGLADSADGWLAGGDKQHSLTVMKDPTVGSAGVIVIVLVLLAKYIVLVEIVADSNWLILLLAPVVSRSLVLFFLLKIPYASQGGIAQSMVDNLPRSLTWFLLLLVVLITFIYFPIAMLFTLMGVYFLYQIMIKRLGGFTGDTLGAVIELSELFLMFSILVLHAH